MGLFFSLVISFLLTCMLDLYSLSSIYLSVIILIFFFLNLYSLKRLLKFFLSVVGSDFYSVDSILHCFSFSFFNFQLHYLSPYFPVLSWNLYIFACLLSRSLLSFLFLSFFSILYKICDFKNPIQCENKADTVFFI